MSDSSIKVDSWTNIGDQNTDEPKLLCFVSADLSSHPQHQEAMWRPGLPPPAAGYMQAGSGLFLIQQDGWLEVSGQGL